MLYLLLNLDISSLTVGLTHVCKYKYMYVCYIEAKLINSFVAN